MSSIFVEWYKCEFVHQSYVLSIYLLNWNIWSGSKEALNWKRNFILHLPFLNICYLCMNEATNLKQTAEFRKMGLENINSLYIYVYIYRVSTRLSVFISYGANFKHQLNHRYVGHEYDQLKMLLWYKRYIHTKFPQMGHGAVSDRYINIYLERYDMPDLLNDKIKYCLWNDNDDVGKRL